MPALQQQLDAAHVDGFVNLAEDLVEAEHVAAGGADIAIKRAEVAFGHAHVRVVDVAIDDVRHHRLGMLPRADAIGEVPEDVRRRLAIQLERLVGINARAIGDPPGEIGNVH